MSKTAILTVILLPRDSCKRKTSSVIESMVFSARLKELLRANGIEQIVFAREIGVTGQCVTRWITGRSIPHGARLLAVAKALNINVSDLFAPVGTPIGAERVHALDELLLLRLWRRMDPRGRAAMLAVERSL